MKKLVLLAASLLAVNAFASTYRYSGHIQVPQGSKCEPNERLQSVLVYSDTGKFLAIKGDSKDYGCSEVEEVIACANRNGTAEIEYGHYGVGSFETPAYYVFTFKCD